MDSILLYRKDRSYTLMVYYILVYIPSVLNCKYPIDINVAKW